MKVTIRFVGSLRSFSGKSKAVLNFEGETSLREAINKIAEMFPEIKRALIDPELGDARPNTLIIVNGREISVLNGLETVLKDGDEIVLIPVSHGG
jgi:molybdopterin synthase sulfur carrier subunit